MTATPEERHRALAEARRITWQGKTFDVSQELFNALIGAWAMLTPDGPFPSELDSFDLRIAGTMETVRLGEVKQLLRLALEAQNKAAAVIDAAYAARKQS